MAAFSSSFVACGNDSNPTPAPADTGTVDVRTDAADARTDAPPADGGVSRAGARCTADNECGGLECDTTYPGGSCTAECTNNASQSQEQTQCGGRGATCLSLGDGEEGFSYCARACNPTARTEDMGACREDQVCTGWWYTHEAAEPDATGCEFFCTTDAQCAGMRCNTRTGECAAMGVDMAARADGEPCDPTVTVTVPGEEEPRNVQCRGICFQSTDNRREGVCGSLVNLRAATACPDNPTVIRPEAPADENGRTDNLALCIYRECRTNADCTRPLVCIPGEMGDPNLCDHPGPGQVGIPGDGGTTTDAATDAAVDAPADAPLDAPADGG